MTSLFMLHLSKQALYALSFMALAISTPRVSALVLRAYSSSQHDRFTGFPGFPSHNSNFIHAGLDLTGVGWHTNNTARQLTMVSPIHFVGANHYKPGVGATIRFLSANGTIKNYTVDAQKAITNDSGDPSDLFYGTLTAPIPETDNVSYHPYLNLSLRGNAWAYQRKNLIILGKTARGGKGVFSTTTDISSSNTHTTRALRWQYNTASGSANDAYLQSGDSGSPVFINQGGIAAIVGTNSLVSTGSTTIYNYANFIPYYADKLNTEMANKGYHMTRAIPGNTTLTLTHTPPAALIRAGHDFTINLTLNNTGSTRADNLKLQNSFPPGTAVSSASGSDWFDESNTSLTKARQAYLSTSSSSNYSITLSIPTAGTAQHQVTYLADQFSSTTASFNLNVIESFISWTSLLTDQSSTGDSDSDNIGNLLEYAFGGDPAVSSQTFPSTTIPLLPSYVSSGGTHSITYLRRKDFSNRALSYNLKSSTTLEAGSWSDASALVTQTTIIPVNAEFEQIKLDLTTEVVSLV